MAAAVTHPARLPDFAHTAGELENGRWLVYPYEAYGQLDRAEWNDQLVVYLAECGVRAEVIDIPKKSVAVVVNAKAVPTWDQVVESIAAIDYRRAMGPR
jgi:hypothetical protein